MIDEIVRSIGSYLRDRIDYSHIANTIWTAVKSIIERMGPDLGREAINQIYDNRDKVIKYIHDRIFGNG